MPDQTYEEDYTDSTASTGSVSISASAESIEQFINSVRSATANTTTTNVRTPANDELETYHPRMEVRALSPYRSPEPGQATVILNKPVPLPDPDIKPKSILKRRPSNENNINDSTAFTKENQKELESSQQEQQVAATNQEISKQNIPASKRLQETPEKEPQQPQIANNLSQKARAQSTLQQPEIQPQLPILEVELLVSPLQQLDIQPQSKIQPQLPTQLIQPQVSAAVPIQPSQPKQQKSPAQVKSPPPTPERKKRGFLNLFGKKTTSTENAKKPTEAAPPAENKVAEKATEREKLSKLRQDSVEENKVEQVAVIDHYSDIVREMGGKPKFVAPVPLYLDTQALREVTARAEREERELCERLQMEQSPPPAAIKINVNDDEDAQEMLEVAKKMNLYTESEAPQSELVEISVEHTKSVSYAVRPIRQPDVGKNNGSIFQADATSLTESTKLCDEADGTVIDTKKQDTLTKMISSTRSRALGRKSPSERRSESKSPAAERKTSLSSTVLKVTRMPIENASNDIDIDLQPSSKSPSPEPRCETPEQMQAESESNMQSTLSYTIDMVMFLLACWLYVYHDPRLSIPVLIVMVSRHAKNYFANNAQKWTKRKSE